MQEIDFLESGVVLRIPMDCLEFSIEKDGFSISGGGAAGPRISKDGEQVGRIAALTISFRGRKGQQDISLQYRTNTVYVGHVHDKEYSHQG